MKSSIDSNVVPKSMHAVMKACAEEIAILGDELKIAKGGLVGRLADSLLSETWLAQSPGVLVVQVPRNLRADDSADLEFKLADGTRFIPSWEAINVVDAEIKQQDILPRDRTLLLGIQVKELEVLFGTTVFFELSGNATDSSAFFRLLPFTQWTYQGRQLQVITRPHGALKESSISKGHEVFHLYDHRFVEIVGFSDDAVPIANESVPLKPSDDATDLKWLHVEFPSSISAEVLKNVRCHLNCIPAVNLTRNSLTRKLERGFQAFELNTHEGFFIGVDDVIFEPNGKREVLPFDEYSIRRTGVTQFDDLDAKGKLFDTLHSIESEFQAYDRIIDTDYKNEMAKLHDNISELKERLGRKTTTRTDPPAFLQFSEVKKNGEIEINYFSTDGELKPKPKKGDQLACKGGSATMMTDFYHTGWVPPEIRVEQLKHEIISRSRIVTKADIISACYAFFGSTIEVDAKDIRKGATISPNPSEGLIDCIYVTIRAKPEANMRKENWEIPARRLEMYLHENSLVGFAFNVSIELDSKPRN